VLVVVVVVVVVVVISCPFNKRRCLLDRPVLEVDEVSDSADSELYPKGMRNKGLALDNFLPPLVMSKHIKTRSFVVVIDVVVFVVDVVDGWGNDVVGGGATMRF